MPYKSDLEAAHNRINALEKELTKEKEKNSINPKEKVFWTFARQRIAVFVIICLSICFVGYIVSNVNINSSAGSGYKNEAGCGYDIDNVELCKTKHPDGFMFSTSSVKSNILRCYYYINHNGTKTLCIDDIKLNERIR
jgi:hypothetical protein